VCQDINQLKSAKTGYGQDESITSNCHIQAACPPNRVETAEHLSKLTGQTTVVKEQVTHSGKNTSRTRQEVQRPLLTVDECLRMAGTGQERPRTQSYPASAGCGVILR
jgi:type IV secretion system protein VirD4